jgi:alanine racemase
VKLKASDVARITGGQLFGDPVLPVSEIVIDSRQLTYTEGLAFFAICGIHHDGHNFVEALYARGIRVFIVGKLPKNHKEYPGSAFIHTSDTIQALQLLAQYKRKIFKSRVIGVTGSAGKTVVKEWLADIIGLTVPVVRSPRSYNSQIGVPLSVWKLDEKYETGIFEAGISMPGEMERLAAIINPDIGVITNIGDAHSENFPDTETKVAEKLRLFENAATIIYCRDYDLIHQNIIKDDTLISKNIIDWSFTNTEAKIYVRRISVQNNRTAIEASYNGSKNIFEVPFTDRASVENAVTVVAVCLALAIDPDIIRKGVSGLVSVAMRMEIKSGINNCQLIEDYYNSDPGSLGMALDYLKMQNKRKTILILSDFIQSGRNEKELYREVANLIRRAGIDKFIGIGPALTRNRLSFGINAIFFWSTDEFAHNFNAVDYKDAIILLKGARIYEFEKIARLLELQMHMTVFEINLDAISHNLNEFRRILNPGTRIMVMVKAFAYGTGSSEIANLIEYHRVSYLAVAYSDEGVELRKSGVSLPVMVMNPDPSAFEIMIRYNLEPEIYDFSSFENFTAVASKHGLVQYPVHIKIDTGMHRLGFMPEDIDLLATMINKAECIKVISVFSHLAGSENPSLDGFTHHQVRVFQDAVNKIKISIKYPFLVHILNSSGIVRFPEYQFDMVRPGIGIYGIGTYNGLSLKIVGRFKTRISQIKKIPAGEPVGYSCADMADSDRNIAILPAGYADGLNRKLGNRNGSLFIKGCRVPLIGNICMDMCMADVTGLEVLPGDEVEIFGENITIEEIAEECDTIPYEILTSIPVRVKRVYYRE